MTRRYIDNGMGERVDITSLGDEACCTSKAKAEAIAKRHNALNEMRACMYCGCPSYENSDSHTADCPVMAIYFANDELRKYIKEDSEIIDRKYLPDNMTVTHVMQDGRLVPLYHVNEDEQDDDNHYGELALNVILIAVIIAILVIAYNVGFH